MAAKPACAPCRAQRRCKTSEGSPLSNSAPLLSEAERAPQYEKPVSAAPEARHNPSRESQAQFRAAAGKHPMDNRLSRPATCREWRAANTLASPQARPAWARADPSRAAGVWRGTPPCPASDGHACSNCAALLIQARAAEKTAHLAMLRTPWAAPCAAGNAGAGACSRCRYPGMPACHAERGRLAEGPPSGPRDLPQQDPVLLVQGTVGNRTPAGPTRPPPCLQGVEPQQILHADTRMREHRPGHKRVKTHPAAALLRPLLSPCSNPHKKRPRPHSEQTKKPRHARQPRSSGRCAALCSFLLRTPPALLGMQALPARRPWRTRRYAHHLGARARERASARPCT
jgi:hypothetical protein